MALGLELEKDGLKRRQAIYEEVAPVALADGDTG